MKTPSKNISKSLDSQSVPGRAAKGVSVTRQSGSNSMVVPGEAGVEKAPGMKAANSAVHHGDANGGRFGGGDTGQ